MENEDLLLKDIIENKSESSLEKLFNLRTSKRKYWLIYGECWTEGQFDDLASKLSSENAFDLIPTSVEICITQKDAALFETALSLISVLASQSNTTEIPLSLKEKWRQIKFKADEIKSKDAQFLIGNIEAWYRNTL